MKIKNVELLITNSAMKKLPDNTDYCSVGVLSLDDGQKFDISVREESIYSKLKPMTKVKVNLELNNSRYGIKLNIKEIVEVGTAI